jgi:agmatine deiminase
MKNLYLVVTLLLISGLLGAQNTESGINEGILPAGFTPEETRNLKDGNFNLPAGRGIEDPPPFDNLRNMAEWEEIQVLTIGWKSYPGILKQIVAHAILEVPVIILTEDYTETLNFLEGSSNGGPIDDMSNVTILEVPLNSVWMRDYAGNPVYGNDVDDLLMVDWIYNRPNRPDDDASPAFIAEELGLDFYCLTQAPSDLVNTGGNWMTDGFGTAFASELILSENEPGNEYGVTAKDEQEINAIMEEWLGVHTYIKMETLPYDQIHHIDMHMKLIDEQTLLVGQFPSGESDGPQIQANMEYVLSSYTNKWGEPYHIVWIPMPSSTNGSFPDGSWGGAAYRTYTNSVFINNTVIVPTYREEFDTTAMAIYADILPGYNVVGIDCDNQPEPIINASGAIHCITHSVGVEDPLLISHNPLPDTESTDNYLVNAYMKHRSGMSTASLNWRLIGETAYNQISMSAAANDEWEANIPGQPVGSIIQYYVEGEAVSGKTQTRPMPAPAGFWEFEVVDELVHIANNMEAEILPVYPNPAKAITVIPVNNKLEGQGTIVIYDVLGQKVMSVFEGQMPIGEKKYFFDASSLSTGAYQIVLQIVGSFATQGLIVE